MGRTCPWTVRENLYRYTTIRLLLMAEGLFGSIKLMSEYLAIWWAGVTCRQLFAALITRKAATGTLWPFELHDCIF
jgi:hypothetical protein